MSPLRTSPILLLLFASACAGVEPRPDFDHARQLIEASTGRGEVFDPLGPPLAEEELEAILSDGLSLEQASRLALVNNRDLQAAFQEIGIAHADWVQAQLLTNPTLDVLLRFPSSGGSNVLEAILGFELLELWRLPVRKQAARLELEVTVLRLARQAAEQLAGARSAYFAAVAQQELQHVAADNLALASRAFEAVAAMHLAGAADALEESLARGPKLSAQLALRAAEIEAAEAKRELAKWLSIERPIEDLALTDPLPQSGVPGAAPEQLVQQALASRLDLRALETAIEALDARVRLEERKAWGDAAAGPSVERPAASGGKLLGPSLSLSLPVFDQNQAQVARAGFELEQLVKLHEAARIAISQDVRSAAARLDSATASLRFFADELLPEAEHALALARASYTSGQSSLLAQIELQRQLLEARRAHVTLRLEAALAAAELERAVGAPTD